MPTASGFSFTRQNTLYFGQFQFNSIYIVLLTGRTTKCFTIIKPAKVYTNINHSTFKQKGIIKHNDTNSTKADSEKAVKGSNKSCFEQMSLELFLKG